MAIGQRSPVSMPKSHRESVSLVHLKAVPVSVPSARLLLETSVLLVCFLNYIRVFPCEQIFYFSQGSLVS